MRVLICCFVLIVAAVAGLSASLAAERPLNLLYITADDMNWDSSGWMGSKLGATPTLDGLAAQSHRFVNHHVTAPICMPSREAMLTGRVPHRSGGLGFTPIRPGTPTLVTTLKAHGYYTAAINKVAHMKPDAEFPWDDTLVGSGKKPPQLREHFTETLRNAAVAGKPFFINVNIQDPHRPFPGSNAADAEEEEGGSKQAAKRAQVKPRKAAKRAGAKTTGLARIFSAEEIVVPAFLEDIPPVREEVAQYFTGVARFDVALRGILEELAESGHAEDTIILFVSDHGMSFPFSKATVYYNGTRSPVILKYPGMPSAVVHEELVGSVDIMPTLLDLLAISQPVGMDGRSWLPLLQGEKQDARDYVITHVNTVSSGASLPQRCIRTRDHALLFHAWPDGSEKFRVEAMSGITFKALAEAGATDQRIAARVKQLRVGEPLMFFDEQADPGERTNLIKAANFRQEIERLASLLLAHMEKTDDPQTGEFSAGTRCLAQRLERLTDKKVIEIKLQVKRIGKIMNAIRVRRVIAGPIIVAVAIFVQIPVAPAHAADSPPKKLNVLFIVSDDLTTTALGAYGQTAVRTPNIDRLAARGVRFDRAYCNYPVCNPSRTSFLSGRYPEATKVLSNATDPRIELGKDYQFLPEYFKAHDYFTAGIGKIAHGAFPRAVSWDVFADPQHPGPGADEDEKPARTKPRNADANKNAGGKKKKAAQAAEETSFPWEATANDDAEEPDGITARRVAKLMEEHQDKPFFIAAGFHKPHVPHTAPQKYFDLYPPNKIALFTEPAGHTKQIPAIAQNNKYHPDFTAAQAQATMSHYFAATTFMDTQVGILLDTLERLDLWSSTIVIFLGDHGWHFGEHGGYWAKGSLFEESARAPLIVAAPGLKANAASPRLVEFVDIYPTLTELAGLPTADNLQGRSFAPLLRDPQSSGKGAIFTVVSRQRSLGRAVRTEKFTYIEWPDGSTQLYDYSQDPQEYVNLSNDATYADTKAELKKVLDGGRESTAPAKVTRQSR